MLTEFRLIIPERLGKHGTEVRILSSGVELTAVCNGPPNSSLSAMAGVPCLDVDACQFWRWYSIPELRTRTIKSVVIDLTPAFVDFLHEVRDSGE